ncbi:hypothetical protein PYCCODRAFT_1421659 [Trametes coccinea BRFM310]|uniref:DUF6532 domain-containing protein n=1 Tax=Trametes coccinea (strain BRFM310) TaxID=1353009 RepID=A0A1Y2J2V1_TRAC3|nr:hypothetical protein PYCCODRAFT_1421659 [Trametes coccinea BRFM310]
MSLTKKFKMALHTVVGATEKKQTSPNLHQSLFVKHAVRPLILHHRQDTTSHLSAMKMARRAAAQSLQKTAIIWMPMNIPKMIPSWSRSSGDNDPHSTGEDKGTTSNKKTRHSVTDAGHKQPKKKRRHDTHSRHLPSNERSDRQQASRKLSSSRAPYLDGQNELPSPQQQKLQHVRKRQRGPEEVPVWSDSTSVLTQCDDPQPDKESTPLTSKKRRKAIGGTLGTDPLDGTRSPSWRSERELDNEHINLVYQKGSRLGILDQRPQVKKVLNAAIVVCQANLLIRNAFPDGAEKYNVLARNALIGSANDLNCGDLVKRLKSDDDYAFALAAIPVDMIPLFRTRAQEAVDGAIRATYNLSPGDVGHVNWLLKGCRYIYPHDYKKDKFSGSEPYTLPIFVDGIRATYFKTPKSFGWKVVHRFTSSLPDKPEEKEIPAPLLALISTAVFAAIDDYRFNPYEASSLYNAVCGRGVGMGPHTGDSDDDLAFLNIRQKSGS